MTDENSGKQILMLKSRRVGGNAMASFMRQSMEANQKAFDDHIGDQVKAMQKAMLNSLIGSDLIKHNRRKLK